MNESDCLEDRDLDLSRNANGALEKQSVGCLLISMAQNRVRRQTLVKNHEPSDLIKFREFTCELNTFYFLKTYCASCD
jgi:hypothetical protein